MKIEIENCQDCPFCNNDNEFGYESCNLALHLGFRKYIEQIGYNQMPADKVHKDCPIRDLNEIELTIKTNL